MSISPIGALPTVALPLEERTIVGSSPLVSLPSELLVPIFGYLGRHHLQATAPVSRGIQRSVIEAANYNELTPIKRFTGQLTERLNDDRGLPETTRLITGILAEIQRQNFTNLRELNNYIPGVKNRLVDVLRTLSEERVTQLFGEIVPPESMENIFELAAIKGLTAEAMEIDQEVGRGQALVVIIEALTLEGNVDRAIAVGRLIPRDFFPREYGLSKISEALARSGNFLRAIEIANRMSDIRYREDTLIYMPRVLETNGDIPGALAFSELLTDPQIKSKALKALSEGLILDQVTGRLAAAPSIDQSISIARSIPDRAIRGSTLRGLSVGLVMYGNIIKATTAFVSQFF